MNKKIKKVLLIGIASLLLVSGWLYLREYRLRYCKDLAEVEQARSTTGRLIFKTPDWYYRECMGRPLYQFLLK